MTSGAAALPVELGAEVSVSPTTLPQGERMVALHDALGVPSGTFAAADGADATDRAPGS